MHSACTSYTNSSTCPGITRAANSQPQILNTRPGIWLSEQEYRVFLPSESGRHLYHSHLVDTPSIEPPGNPSLGTAVTCGNYSACALIRVPSAVLRVAPSEPRRLPLLRYEGAPRTSDSHTGNGSLLSSKQSIMISLCWGLGEAM